jgi:hypothetical protein
MDELLEEQATYMPHTNDANGDNENAHENRNGCNIPDIKKYAEHK